MEVRDSVLEIAEELPSAPPRLLMCRDEGQGTGNNSGDPLLSAPTVRCRTESAGVATVGPSWNSPPEQPIRQPLRHRSNTSNLICLFRHRAYSPQAPWRGPRPPRKGGGKEAR